MSNVKYFADTLVENQNFTHPYRQAWYYAPGHVFFTTLSWGNANGGPWMKFLMLVWYLSTTESEKQKYFNAVSVGYDYIHGCNHQGRTFTTGLGKMYPVKLLSHPTWYLQTLGIRDPVPGISLFTYTGSVEYEAIHKMLSVNLDSDRDFNFIGYMYPVEPYFNETLTENYTFSYGREKILAYKNIPIYHRYQNLEHLTVPTAEYTIEVIAQMAMTAGFLLKSPHAPTEEMKNVAPKPLNEIPGIWVLP